jgi:DNA-binding transcriptional MerR regulator
MECMESPWTLAELVAEVAARIAALPAPKNGQVRAIPDERTIRYYATIGLLDRPAAMRGRTALYGRKHVAQVVAIKRLQTLGRSLAEIQELWPTLDDHTLARMSGVAFEARPKSAARAAFWTREPAALAPESPASAAEVIASATPAVRRADDEPALDATAPAPATAAAVAAPAAVELRVELAPSIILSLSVVDESIAISPADIRAIRAAAAPLLAELVSRRLASHPGGEEP